MPPGNMNHLRAEGRKAQFLELFVTKPTATITQLCQEIGIKTSTYNGWRQYDDHFRGKVEVIRGGRVRDGGQRTTGGFAEKREKYFPQAYPTPKFHLSIIDKLESAPPMSVSMILVPPNFAKTTLLEDWSNIKLGEDPNHRLTVVSKSQGQARKMLGRIQNRMTDVSRFAEYIGRYGPFYVDGQSKTGKPWTRDYFTVARADHDERDYSLQVLGWSGQVYGSRVDTLILDDIQTRDNLTSVEEMINKLSLEFLTRGDENMRTFIIGTRIEVGDIYERLIDTGVVDESNLYIMPAITIGENGEEQSLWPERWPVEKLAIMRKNIQEKAWWCGYMMNPQRGGQATFPEDMLERAKNPLRPFGLVRLPDTPYLPTAMGLDPALGGGNAISVLSYTMDKIYFVDCLREVGLARTEQILTRLEEFANAYHPQDLIIENVAFQRGLARDDRLQSMAQRYGFTIHEHATNRNKQDPVLGVGSMAGSFLRGEFDIPWADEYTQTRFEPLLRELLAWRPDIPTKMLQQDLVMATWFPWLFIQTKRHSMGMDASSWRRSGLAQFQEFQPTPMPLSRAGNRGYL